MHGVTIKITALLTASRKGVVEVYTLRKLCACSCVMNRMQEESTK